MGNPTPADLRPDELGYANDFAHGDGERDELPTCGNGGCVVDENDMPISKQGYNTFQFSMLGKNRVIARLRNTGLAVKMQVGNLRDGTVSLLNSLNVDLQSKPGSPAYDLMKSLGLPVFSSAYNFMAVVTKDRVEIHEDQRLDSPVAFSYVEEPDAAIPGLSVNIADHISTTALLNYLQDLKEEYRRDTSLAPRVSIIERAEAQLERTALSLRRTDTIPTGMPWLRDMLVPP